MATAEGVVGARSGEWASEWADVGRSIGAVAAPPAPPEPADLRLVMASIDARRDLRRVLIALGAIGAPPPVTSGPRPTARTSDVVGAVIAAPPEVVLQVLTKAGAITARGRLARFASMIHSAGRRCVPADPQSVLDWVRSVAGILREDPLYI